MSKTLSGGTRPGIIKRDTLGEQVANYIRDRIIEGQLKQGERINEVALGAELGVSRTPLREALRTLAAEGLIELRPAQGAVVRELTPQDVFSMLEVLGHLEGLAGRLCCERATDAEIEEVLDLHERMLDYYRKRDRLPYYKLNQEIHSRISALSGNATLQQVQANIQSRLKRIRFLGNERPEAWDEAVAEHEEMAEALRRRDGEALGRVLERHLMKTWERVKTLF